MMILFDQTEESQEALQFYLFHENLPSHNFAEATYHDV